ncbi:AAA domain-containing protein [Paenibacillus algorifonticola]|uniref:AAA domain-containing protein n=1 Tax=Paenibacillus algorifonticola TaxID=684063 RepID=A0A1I2BPE5_9BACL|nr:AAA family ATPase [Paenibacillus algorifonticola]SFE57887.1 AAA domain-containing protein [Paenibacillus algorifonticola]
MRLNKLSADKHTFHTVPFKPGLNLIVGKKNNPSDNNVKNTYNGVGKSLIIYLIHFCLGSNKIKVFEEKIPNWHFTLEFEIDDVVFTSSRNTSKQNEIYLNEKKYTITNFRRLMLKKVFNNETVTKNLTFNTLFPRFIRRDRECYAKYDTFIRKEQDYSKFTSVA